ncbi:MAG TPA: hypothetical protein VIW26_03480 [Gemmatimonadales bacterium]
MATLPERIAIVETVQHQLRRDIEDVRDLFEHAVAKTQEHNQWLVRGIVITVLGSALAAILK